MPEVELSQWQIKNLAVPLLDKVATEVQEFFKVPENEQRFRKWYEQTYGKPVPQGV